MLLAWALLFWLGLWPAVASEVGAGEAGTTASRHMVAAANPLAAEAGRAILRQGGSAVDAAIAVQMVLTLVEPQSSGIGGGAFLLHWDATDSELTAFDGRETAPAAATPDLFLKAGKPMAYTEGVVGGRAVGTPGVLRMLELAHGKAGRLPWSRLFQPAIDLARNGFLVSQRLAALLAVATELDRSEASRSYFFDQHKRPRRAGERLKNPELAKTLDEIARLGADRFYNGRIAGEIVAAVGQSSRPGSLALSDLSTYQAKQRPAVCGGYRRFRVCGMGPPSAGGISLLQILKLLEGFDLPALAPHSVEAAHLIAQAGRLGYADRLLYLADDDFVPVPVEGLLDGDYLAARRGLIALGAVSAGVVPGVPPGAEAWPYGREVAAEKSGTSHFSIVDAEGNIVSMTTTIEAAFGSRLMAAGFLLNNELSDFSWRPEGQGKPIANRVEPGKRPLSTMAPTIVFDEDDRPVLVLGSPGGARIVNYVAKTLIAILDWGMEPQAAVDLPNLAVGDGPIELEKGSTLMALAPKLQALGHEVAAKSLNSGVQLIMIDRDKLRGAADRRREGVALGD